MAEQSCADRLRAPGPPPVIRFRCLGSVELTDADGSSLVDVLSQPKRVALLSYIALFNHGGFVPRDRLLEVFWPESDTERARNSLNQALHQLRSTLGPDALETRGRHELRLNREVVWCDALAFRETVEQGRVDEATELYRGDLLEGLHAANGPGFERWLDEERTRLRRRYCDAAWQRAEEAGAAGDTAGAVAQARAAVSKAPFDEIALRRLMELLARLGDRAEALRAYDRFVGRLERDLDVEPDPETVELAAGLRAGGGEERRSVGAGRPVVPPAPADRRGPALETRTGRHHRRWAVFGLVAASLVAVALVQGGRTAAPPAESARKLVIVQPFENRTGDPALDFVGDAAADAVAAGLNNRAVDVSAVVTPDPGAFDVPDALLVTGYYEESDGILSMRARVALATGEPVRLEGPVTGPVQDANQALAELSERIAVIAVVRLGETDVMANQAHRAGALPALTAPLPKWEAWREASHAEAHAARGEWSRALERLKRAVQIDPDFTGAYLRLALQYANTGDFKTADSVLSIVRDRRADLNPLQLNNLEWLTAAMANDRQERLRLHRESLALRGRTDDLQLSHELIGLNRPREALEVLDRLDEEAMYRDGVERYWTFQARAHHLLGDHDAELAATRLGSQRFPNHLAVIRYEASALGALGRIEELEALVEAAFSAPVHGGCCPSRVPLNGGLELLAHGYPESARRIIDLGAELHARRVHETERERERHADMLLAAERWDGAKVLYEKLHAARPDKVSYVGGLGVIAARTGDTDAAARIFDELEPGRFYGMDRPVAILFRARMAAALGQGERAMQLLRDGTAGGLTVEEALHQPEFVELRKSDAFRRWAEPVG